MRVKLFLVFIILSYVSFSQSEKQPEDLFTEYQKKCDQYNKKRQLDSVSFFLNKIDVLLGQLKDSSYYYRRDLIKGTYFIGKNEYNKAMQQLLKASYFFKRQNDSSNFYLSKYKIAICNYYLVRREKAKVLFNEVVKNGKHVDESIVVNSMANLGVLELEHGIINKDSIYSLKALPYFRKAISYNYKHKNYTHLASNYSLLAECYIQLNDYERAFKILDSAIYYAKEDKNISQEGFAILKQVDLLTKNKDYGNATNLINKAVTIYRDANDLPSSIYAFIKKKQLLVAMKNYKEANSISDSIHDLSLKNYDKKFADGITEMETKYKTVEKEREILIQKANLAEKELVIQKRNYQIYSIVAGIVILSLLGFFFFRQLIKSNKLKVALQQIETQNKLQDQRLQISRDLHDNIGAQLSFVISSIESLKFMTKNTEPKFKNDLSSLSEFTSEIITQLRDTIWAMNKDEISIDDLQFKINSFVEKAKMANRELVIHLFYDIQSVLFFSSIKGMNLFRVIQEAINNAMKHAGASRIDVELIENKNNVTFKIKDDGDGFDMDSIVMGNGINNIRKRVDAIEGEVSFESKKGKGTVITIICDKELMNNYINED